MKELDKVLDVNEKTLWEGKPQFLPYFISVVPVILFGLFFLQSSDGMSFSTSTSGTGIVLPNFLVGVLAVFVWPLYRFLTYKYIYYTITDKRIIFQSGLIGRDFKFIDYNQISNAEVNVGFMDKVFGRNSGSISISSAGTFSQGKYGPIATPYKMENVTDPYEVFKFFKKVSYDVKTDVEYPNKFRPDTNPGFQTSYDPNQTPPQQ